VAGTVSVASSGGFEIGRVLARAAGMVRQRFGSMLIIALLLAALPTPIRLLGAEAFGHALRGGGSGQFFIYLLAVLAGGVFGGLCAGALILLAIGEGDGRRVDAADALYLALRSAPRLIALYLMVWIAIGAAMLLLVVPGIMLAVSLEVAMPAAVIEGRGGARAFDRSFGLTKGARWQVFALLAMVWVVLGAVGFVIPSWLGPPPSINLTAPPIAYLLIHGVVAIVSAIVAAALQSSIYVELRTWKEGAPQDELRDIFA
jgi:hypothetical protein